MKTMYAAVLALSIVGLTACNSAPKNNQSGTTTDQAAAMDMSADGGITVSDVADTVVAGTESLAAPTMAIQGAVKMNPPHGQPGHDCAIPVGAPLNAPAVAPVAGEVKVNPPHGMPGHDCAIPVGAPLK